MRVPNVFGSDDNDDYDDDEKEEDHDMVYVNSGGYIKCSLDSLIQSSLSAFCLFFY